MDGEKNWISWISSSNPPDISIASFNEIYMLNSEVGWIVGSYDGPAYIIKTIDGGETWSDETPKNVLPGFESISMLDSLHGFIVGGQGELYETINGGEITDVGSIFIVNEKFSLSQNYPNPFNPTTTIRFSIMKESFARLDVFDELGRRVKTLINQKLSAGNYNVVFDATNLSRGIYFYRLMADKYISMKKAILLK